MGRETWGTFSVKDHKQVTSYVAGLMLYDRLVVPVPPKGSKKEWERWKKEGWCPSDQEELLNNISENRLCKIEWDEYRQKEWSTRFNAAGEITQDSGRDAFQYTRTYLTENLPGYVTGVTSIINYPSLESLKKELGLRTSPDEELLPCSAVTAVLGWEFLVPDDQEKDDIELLKDSLKLSSKPSFVRKRAAFWRWLREFTGDSIVTDQEALTKAVDEMHELVGEEKKSALKKGIKIGTKYAFLVGSITLGMLGGPISAVGLGGAFISIGQIVADRLLEERDKNPSAGALFFDVNRHFGWK